MAFRGGGFRSDAGSGGTVSLMQRRESVLLQGISTSITGTTPSAAILSAATDPLTVEYQGSGGTDAELISNTGGEADITFITAGLYDLKWEGQVDIATIRPTISLGIWNSGDTIGTDDPIAIISTQYVRGADSNQKVFGYADIQIDADNTEVKVAAFNFLDPDTTSSFTLDTGSKLYIRKSGIT